VYLIFSIFSFSNHNFKAIGLISSGGDYFSGGLRPLAGYSPDYRKEKRRMKAIAARAVFVFIKTSKF